MVTVGLQLPESEAQGAPNGRLSDKFPSTTTLWLVLRKFEAGVAGGGPTRNITGRGIPGAGNGTGSGRLYYEIPVVQALGRELATFDDLQKSLAQLGFNSGSILLRLSFRRTEEPLESAMIKIGDYFRSVEDSTPEPQAQPAPAPAQDTETSPIDGSQPKPPPADQPSRAPGTTEQTPEASHPPVPSTKPSTTDPSRSITVFAPPSSSTPLSAQTTHNETDYIPSIDHAQTYQRRLNAASRPNRLPNDSEVAAKAAAEEGRLASVKEVDVKVRLPDQSQIVAKFGQQDTGKTLYGFVRNCMSDSLASERFLLSFFPSAGPAVMGGKKMQNVVRDSEGVFLIKNLGMVGRVLVNFSWDANASSGVREGRTSVLKPELQSQAQEHKVEQPPDILQPADAGESSAAPASREEKPSARRSGGMPKWLKLPGKK